MMYDFINIWTYLNDYCYYKQSESSSIWDKNTTFQVLFKLTCVSGWNVLSLIGNHVTKAVKH